MEKKRALVICDFSVQIHPSAENALMYAKILNCLGYQVQVWGFDAIAKRDNFFLKDGIELKNYSAMLKNHTNKGYIQRRKIKRDKFCDALARDGKIELFIYMGDYAGILYKLINKESARRGGEIICQVCEWYDRKKVYISCKSIMDYVWQSARYMNLEFARKYWFVKNKNLLVVSNYLKDYYTKKGCRCIVMPNLINILDNKPIIRKRSGERLKLGYFGSPGLHNCKDSLLNVILGINLLKKEQHNKIQLDIYGPTEQDLTDKLDIPISVMENLSGCVFAHGIVGQEEVRKKLRDVDFTVLLRENTRSNNCGLSSKAGESLANGVPIICNLTSDMDLFVINGISGIVCKDETPESFAESLEEALLLTSDELYTLKINSYEIGLKTFDYRNYINKFEKYLANIKMKETNCV